MDVFSTELGIRLSFVKISGFQGGFEPPKPPSVCHCQVGRRKGEEIQNLVRQLNVYGRRDVVHLLT
jgi:hypothetical protein